MRDVGWSIFAAGLAVVIFNFNLIKSIKSFSIINVDPYFWGFGLYSLFRVFITVKRGLWVAAVSRCLPCCHATLRTCHPVCGRPGEQVAATSLGLVSYVCCCHEISWWSSCLACTAGTKMLSGCDLNVAVAVLINPQNTGPVQVGVWPGWASAATISWDEHASIILSCILH